MIPAYLGQALLLVALAGCLYGIWASFRGARSGNDQLILRGLRATRLVAFASILAMAVLATALLADDFVLAYAADRTNRALPWIYKLTATWSGQEGSLLFWLSLLTAFGVLLGRPTLRAIRATSAPTTASWERSPRSVDASTRTVIGYANGVVLVTASFFALLVAFVSRPFAVVQTVPHDGAGMSPALQNYWMAIHPPMLYLGYVGVAIPFAIVAGALLSGSGSRGALGNDRWIRSTRRWALVAWTFLTLGLVFGARWAYEEIGWGGYWAWDPVESAALMPWLATTAYLHSIMVQEKRGMMRFWNVVLVATAFCLSIFGTFLTRSGILSSVHSFVESSIGWWFVGFLALAIATSVGLLAWRRDALAARHDVDRVVSREAVILFNNLLLAGITLTVLWGVLYPIVTDTLTGERVSLQAPWYNFFAVTFGLPLVALTGIGPLVSWQGSEIRRLLRALVVPIVASFVAGAIFVAFGLASSPAGAAALSLGVFLLVATGVDTRRGLRAARSSTGGGVISAARHMATRNRRRIGGIVAHVAVALAVMAIAGSNAYVTSREVSVAPGATTSVGGYRMTYLRATRTRDDNAMRIRVELRVHRGDHDLGILRAGKNFYPASGEVSNEVAIHHRLTTGEDLYVIVDRLDEHGNARLKLLVNPLVSLLWLAGLLLAAGGVLAAWPSRRGREAQDRMDAALRARSDSAISSRVTRPLPDTVESDRIPARGTSIDAPIRR